MDGFFIAFADFDQMLRHLVCGGVAVLEVDGEITAFATQAAGIFIESFEQLEDLA